MGQRPRAAAEHTPGDWSPGNSFSELADQVVVTAVESDRSDTPVYGHPMPLPVHPREAERADFQVCSNPGGPIGGKLPRDDESPREGALSGYFLAFSPSSFGASTSFNFRTVPVTSRPPVVTSADLTAGRAIPVRRMRQLVRRPTRRPDSLPAAQTPCPGPRG